MTNPQTPNDALREALARAAMRFDMAAHNSCERAPVYRKWAEEARAALAQSQEPASSPSETLAQKQAREVMNPGFGSAMSALNGQAYNAPASAPVAQEVVAWEYESPEGDERLVRCHRAEKGEYPYWYERALTYVSPSSGEHASVGGDEARPLSILEAPSFLPHTDQQASIPEQSAGREGEAEPSAWMYDGPDGQHYIHEHRDIAYQQLLGWGWTETPLYARQTELSPSPVDREAGWTYEYDGGTGWETYFVLNTPPGLPSKVEPKKHYGSTDIRNVRAFYYAHPPKQEVGLGRVAPSAEVIARIICENVGGAIMLLPKQSARAADKIIALAMGSYSQAANKALRDIADGVSPRAGFAKKYLSAVQCRRIARAALSATSAGEAVVNQVADIIEANVSGPPYYDDGTKVAHRLDQLEAARQIIAALSVAGGEG